MDFSINNYVSLVVTYKGQTVYIRVEAEICHQVTVLKVGQHKIACQKSILSRERKSFYLRVWSIDEANPIKPCDILALVNFP